jgi:hypothetical protein
MISPEDNAKTMPPVQGAVWVEPYERNGVTVSGYWRGPNGRRIEYADTSSEWKSRDFYLNKKLDDPNTTVINTIYNNAPFNLRNPYEAVSNFQDYASVLDDVIETDPVPGEAERGRGLMEELANAYHAVSWYEVSEYAFKAGVRPEPGHDQARLLTYYPDNGEMSFANVYWPLEVQPNGEKTYARVDRPEAVHSPNPTPVDYRAFVDPAWYPAQKAAFQHIDEFLRNSDDYSIRDMIQDFR